MKRKFNFSVGASALFVLVFSFLFIGLFCLEKSTTDAKISDTPLECITAVGHESDNIERTECVSESNISAPDSQDTHNEQEMKPAGRMFCLAGTNIPMAFADGDWSDELKNLVCEDMNLVILSFH